MLILRFFTLVMEIDVSRDVDDEDIDDDDDNDGYDPIMQAMPTNETSIYALEKVESKDIDLADDCMICLEELSTRLALGIICIQCSHLYHYNCIVEWLRKNHWCPLCRFEMPINSEL